jgi:predicted dehydrogenase
LAIRVGLLGAGFIGQTHAQAYGSLPDAELVAVADINREAADQLAQQTDARPLYDLDSLLSAKDVQAVDICLPTFLHEECVVKAAQQGKHILCEKPVALTIAQVDNMIDAIQETGVIAMVAQVIRFWPEYVTIRKLYEAGSLGQPVFIRAARLAKAPDWSSWFSNPELSGGAAIDLHIHDLDFVYSLLGRPVSVFATGARSEANAWDYIVTTLNYGKTKAVVEASYLMPDGFPFEMAFRLLGTEACAEYRFRVGGQVDERDSASKELVVYRSNCEPEHPDCPKDDGYQAEIAYFVRCVAGKRDPTVATFRQAREVLEIATAAKQSAEAGTVIQLQAPIH